MVIFSDTTEKSALKRGTTIRKRKFDLCNIARFSQQQLSLSSGHFVPRVKCTRANSRSKADIKNTGMLCLKTDAECIVLVCHCRAPPDVEHDTAKTLLRAITTGETVALRALLSFSRCQQNERIT